MTVARGFRDRNKTSTVHALLVSTRGSGQTDGRAAGHHTRYTLPGTGERAATARYPSQDGYAHGSWSETGFCTPGLESGLDKVIRTLTHHQHRGSTIVSAGSNSVGLACGWLPPFATTDPDYRFELHVVDFRTRDESEIAHALLLLSGRASVRAKGKEQRERDRDAGFGYNRSKLLRIDPSMSRRRIDGLMEEPGWLREEELP